MGMAIGLVLALSGAPIAILMGFNRLVRSMRREQRRRVWTNRYDRRLAECCDTHRITHLLGVLPPGADRDAERERVEGRLTECGVRLPFAGS